MFFCIESCLFEEHLELSWGPAKDQNTSYYKCLIIVMCHWTSIDHITDSVLEFINVQVYKVLMVGLGGGGGGGEPLPQVPIPEGN